MDKQRLQELFEERGIQLTERETEVLFYRYCTDTDEVRSLEETAEHFGVTRERIRQIEAKALRRPVHLTRAKKMKDFYN